MQIIAKFDKIFYNFAMNKNNLPFVFAFVFLVVLSFVLPNLGVTKTVASSNPSAISQGNTETQSQTNENNFVASANGFYSELSLLDSVGPFASFYEGGEFKTTLLNNTTSALLEETTELFKIATEKLVLFKQNSISNLNYADFVSNDDVGNIINELYSKIMDCCGL